MAMPSAEAASISPGECRSRPELVLELIALRHQIAVLVCEGTRRPCFGLWNSLFVDPAVVVVATLAGRVC